MSAFAKGAPRWLSTTYGVAVVALMAPPALAQDTQQPQAQADQMQLAQEDRYFAAEAAQGGFMEVRLGELAQQQAKRTEVKDFGQRMVVVTGRPTTN
jgi:predicted outer membrane protein